MASPGVRIECQSDVLVMTLNNPAAGNEITGAMFDAMSAVLAREALAPRARVLHIRAEGNVFCRGRERAGACIRYQRERPAERNALLSPGGLFSGRQ